ncbi:glycosyltransferase family 9 protein [Flavobacterium sp. ARAG 55.4]|uniref:Glycosyltransferase family 9 protein n=1 Tax=Flavobacterium plantiphilum TaxID=3163297 RepID=A0ABW8XT23_9FLAO
MKILVIQQKMIGDVLISSIICNNLRKAYPNAQIDYLVNSFTVPVIINNKSISNIIQFSDKYRKNKLSFFKFILEIRKEKYDIVIDAYGKLESCLITYFSGAPQRIGYREKDKFFAYNKKVAHPDKKETYQGLAIERRLNLFSFLMQGQEIDSYPHLFLTPHEIAEGALFFENHNINIASTKIIMISAFGSEENKTYPIPYLIELLNAIAAHHPHSVILLNYLPSQKNKIEDIVSQCNAEAKKNINLDLIGNDLRSLVKILYHCTILIGNDGGAVNIAKALNKPTFTLFSPWIDKDSWSIFEDGIFHKAVHLKDFQPEIFTKFSRKQLKKEYQQFYQKLKPVLFQDEMILFINKHINSNV